ncbi:uncharacterized protein LOC129913752 isoform X9 [Episyrphus balteatus]|uniref:uncharacterized protein LOC129913752 isoform X9 n=1 Tax=Episyrphus balteatus TaxID=286459 RepID=UPI002486A0C8|nr:uncharacterized protein LOC129913752 isoform X9 [Episyrphus balteatus]
MPSSLSQRYKQSSTMQQRSSDEQFDDFDLLDQEAKRQIILKRRRLFSQYRQYEQWRKKQFSYDSYHYRPLVNAAAATKRRRLYRRQYSCVEHSEGSRDSHDSKYYIPNEGSVVGAAAAAATTTKPSRKEIYSASESNSFDGVDCGALTYQPLHLNSRDEPSTSIAERCTRSRINSAIFVSSEGRGFDSIEFLRRHGSQSVLCRKARSAENITDNERKKSFSENRHWRTDEGEAQSSASGGKGGEAIELNDVGPAAAVVRNNSNGSGDGSNEITTQCTAMTCHSATAVTTANVIVGSISIETPPSHLKDDITVMKKQQSQEDSGTATESGEDFKQSVTTTATSTTTTIQQQRPRKLVHQRSSNASGNYSQSSPGGSPHHSTKNLSLKNVKQRIIALPMVSVSGPSPPHDKDYL